MKKKILLISYYAPPLNAVSSYRIDSFLNFLIKYGYHVTLVTRHWDLEYKEWEDAFKTNDKSIEIVEKENGKTIYLPYTIKAKQFSNRFINKSYYLYQFLKGNLQPEIDTYNSFYPFLSNFLKTEKFDLMIGSMPPNNTVKLLYKLNRSFEIPYILDFRDFFNNTIFDLNNRFNFTDYIIKNVSIFWLNKWSKKALFAISISKPFSDKIQELLSIKVHTITNGFEKEKFGIIQNENNSKFTIRYIGSCSEKQDFQLFIEAYNLFIADKKETVIELIGTMNKEIEDMFSSQIDSDFLNIKSTRVSKEKTIEYTESSDLLLFPTWHTFKGVYSTKIFDYIASNVNILFVKSDNDVIEELVKDTNCGKICSTKNEILDYLNIMYNEWSSSGKIKYRGDKTKVESYSRENQTLKLIDCFKDL